MTTHPPCQARLDGGRSCARPAVWQQPTDHALLRASHAPADRPRCVACGRPGAWRHPSDGWLCAAHAPTDLLALWARMEVARPSGEGDDPDAPLPL